MKKIMIARFVSAILSGFFWMQLPVWAEGPLVIVVHGVGGGNRPTGWSDETRDAYKIPPANWVEVNFHLAGRDEAAVSMLDFAYRSGEWASQVQQGITRAVKAHPGQKVMIVSHSWGSIATSIALNGGAMPGAELNPIQLEGRRIARWLTLGSPLGRANNPNVAPNLRQLNVQVSEDRPTTVDAWANIYDVDDPVSMQSHNLAGAENFKVTGSAAYGDSAHTGIWLNPATTKLIQQYYQELEQSVGRISVTIIRKKDNTGVAGARVVAMLSGGANSAATTDKQGEAILEAIPIGAYVVEATPLSGAGLNSGRASLELHDAESASLTITLEEDQKPDTARWAGEWFDGDYHMSVSGSGDAWSGTFQAEFKDGDPKHRDANGKISGVQCSGNEATGRWESDYSDSVKQGKRWGTFKIRFVPGKTPAEDRVTGEWREQGDALVKVQPDTAMCPGRVWPVNWKRKK